MEEFAAKVLILDSDAELKKEVFASWSLPDTRLLESSGGQGAIRLLSEGDIAVLFLSTELLTIDNLDIAALARERNPGIEIFILTSLRDTAKAEEAVKRGAHSFLNKPVNVALLESLAKKALGRSVSRRNTRELQEHVLEDLLGSSPAMKKILKTLTKVAPTGSTILISGESGTGKEFVSNVIHRLSARADEAFVAVNCGAIPENLVEAELFGSKKGSYTGSVGDRKGLIEMADKGTLFLDEIGELSLQTQVKLLRFLQEREIRRVGDTENRYVDTRVIAATNRDLHQAIAAGTFREDLYYRLSVFHITLPPLRERRNSIPSLIRSFVKKYATREKKDILGIAKAAEAVLMAYEYPGNIRQLENIIEHAVTLCEGDHILLGDLPEYLTGGEDGPALHAPQLAYAPAHERPAHHDSTHHIGSHNFSRTEDTMTTPDTLLTLAQLERDYILRALDVCQRNHTEAARRLGISRSTLWRKLKEHGMEAAGVH
jgi:two-component system nitrogen regulation response regulator GlnG